MAPSTSKLRPIVLVDDTADDLVVARRKLEQAGVRNPVLTFISSEDALAHFEILARGRRTPSDLFPAVVFIDIKMPRLDGFELLRWLRREKAFSYVKIVMLCDSKDNDERAEALRLGADHYHAKFPGGDTVAEIVASAC